jgi:siroheme synthase (precorrin-2 oxidase/ferrochelatase)
MSGRRVNASSEGLRRLASELKQSADQMEETAKRMRSAVDNADWNDSERKRFEEQLTATVRQLHVFAESVTGEFVPALQRKAAHLDAYGGR